ncbi:hypothetical protein EJ02DRAFT_430194 [Clathrospora elynae]|uniref:Mid2 domain-containing protein n=1 Tax=Clathrospora elynae TaxID=706981 RepID=A0A6A5T477_9PLEO|nr:hypothetical protein EJ02DRAFT_430194 [Clathrospora elynae]
MDTDATANTTTLYSVFMLVTPVIVYWQETDLPKFDPEYAAIVAKRLSLDFTPTATESITAATAAPPDRSHLTLSTPTAPSDPSTSAHGLTTGAKAGIGIGAVVGVLLLIPAFLLYKCIGRRKRKGSTVSERTALQHDEPELVQVRGAGV